MMVSAVEQIHIDQSKADNSELLAKLKQQVNNHLNQSELRIEDYPVQIPASCEDEFKTLNMILNKAVKQIVKHYFKDKRIREKYQLDDDLELILMSVADLPYEVGYYRPDFIINEKGQFKICEIGCRYPLNGWMLSHYLNNPSIDNNDSPEFVTDFKGNDLYLVRNLEKGSEIFYYLDELGKKGKSFIDIGPKDLSYLELKNNDFILELDREELKGISLETIREMTRCSNVINDVRSLILVHDKSILSVLYDQELMEDYITSEEYSVLKSYLIPSYSLSSKTIRKLICKDGKNWILKRKSGGRGIDMHIKFETENWDDLIQNEYEHYTVQRYIEQEVFVLIENDSIQHVHLVGMLLFKNDKSFGPGIFRASSEKIINVHGGRAIILPCNYSSKDTI